MANSENRTGFHHWAHRVTIISLMVVHTGLVAWASWRYSPTQDEIGHLAAGLGVWKFQDFSLYRVNPPLVRTIAAAPLLFVDHEEDWSEYHPGATIRQEFDLGQRLFVANGTNSLWMLSLARWSCLPLTLIGLLICWQWGREIAGEPAGLVAASFWCFSPNIIGHGALITSDIAGASCGLLAAWQFSRWLERPSWRHAFLAGLSLGLALLSKLSWVVFFPIWPMLWVSSRVLTQSPRDLKKEVLQFILIMGTGINLLNLGYLFDGTGTPIGELGFYSTPLVGQKLLPGENLPQNRFRATIFENIPSPFPREFLLGLDAQKSDFEWGATNYFLGETKVADGWLLYYVTGLFLKVPLVLWVLFAWNLRSGLNDSALRKKQARLLPLIVPAVAILTLASLQPNLNSHIRYVYPVLPCLFLVAALGTAKWFRFTLFCLALFSISSLSVYPYSLSYFNYSIGGPSHGHKYLIDSNLDWGQDMIAVREWIAENPDSQPVRIKWRGFLPLEVLGIDAELAKTGEDRSGTLILSLHELQRLDSGFQKFQRERPIGRVGYSFNIYHVNSNNRSRNSTAESKINEN
ncbi:glycosyltransferase family 39 protein [Thalassoglobus sp. JC818]|uniref:glycosyltransferase family 39 protein n=1 Tax=Thalassoglobus sp. JC818 TaxID=3232136 RepID=UPI003458EA9D